MLAAVRRRKVSPMLPLTHPHKAPEEVRELFDEIEGRKERVELNLYVTGYEDAPENQPEERDHGPDGGEGEKDTTNAEGAQGQPEAEGAAGRQPPEESSMPETPQNAPDEEDRS